VQEVTGDAMELAFVDQYYTDKKAAQDAQATGTQLEVVKLPTSKRGFVLMPRRFGWMVCFRRLAWDYERLPQTVAGLHFLAFAILMLSRVISCTVQSA
jgi:hypothetical protein